MKAPHDNAAVDPVDGGNGLPDEGLAPRGVHPDRYATPEGQDPPDDYADRSLFEDVEALFIDGKTYLGAEIAFQKSRAAYAAQCTKRGVAYGVIGAVVAFLALIGLTVGLILGLSPLITAWGATAVVVGLWLIVALIAFRAAAKNFGALGEAFSDDAGETE
ncbi:phage holin family protein [Paraurantiacibacter namhicola]|uniref:Phage holin family protein n=1 Tax=Paraurantiacibacter namhicola TaxID=645517 RepID=A0A1C7D8X1_9SPHN|nr:phage holin family protein [Paraurantiacibacter namhicola]ANU07930.1 hypothetical protein A6F65_01631 [Paraurantiacibacter namhicola]